MTTPRTWDLSTPGSRERFLEEVDRLVEAGKRPFAKILEEPRSTDQNAMIYALYTEIGNQSEDMTPEEVRRYCKLHFGVPILRRDSDKFRETYNRCMLHTLNYEQKLLAMDILDITSILGMRQATEYIEAIIRHFSQQGYCLATEEEQEHYHG